MRTGAVTCPQEIRTKNRRISKKKLYRSVAWKRSRDAFCEGKKCEWCGTTENLLPHHPYKDTPDEAYSDLYLSECVVLCNTCHFHLEKRHEKPCPECGGWMKDDPFLITCRACDFKKHPEKKAGIEARKAEDERLYQENKDRDNKRRRDAKAKHPCVSFRTGGKCGLSTIGSRCTYARTKALTACSEAVAKKGGRA
jgi:hypothetical protein